MIYLDSSTALAFLLVEDRLPSMELWRQEVVSSRLLQYEVWTRLHRQGRGDSHGEAARSVLARVAFLELSRPVLERALEPFPGPVRTLDALHLASMEFLRRQDQLVLLASYDDRLAAVARAMGFSTWEEPA